MQFELRLTKVTTTLHDFERFLSNEFQDYQMFIALYAVHESNLTFVCTVPAFIEEKLVDHIIKNQYKLSSWGLQDVIIWDTSVFDKPVDQVSIIITQSPILLGVSIHLNGIVDWNTGMKYYNDLFHNY